MASSDLKTEQGFTPGPWQVLKGDRCWHVASMDRTFETGCIMFAGGEGSGEANARLIAAAPALYEIAQRLVEIHQIINGAQEHEWEEEKLVDQAYRALALVKLPDPPGVKS